jgi:hypothetical protein
MTASEQTYCMAKLAKQPRLILKLMEDSSVSDAQLADHLRSQVKLTFQSLQILERELLLARPGLQEEVIRLLHQHRKDGDAHHTANREDECEKHLACRLR